MSKVPGKKRKTVLYWKRLLKEAAIDWTDVERLSSDRDGWKELVNVRMNHLDVWERQRGHEYVWGENEVALSRNIDRGELDLTCRYEGCGKVCKSKGGLTIHQKRMHRVAEGRVTFDVGGVGRY